MEQERITDLKREIKTRVQMKGIAEDITELSINTENSYTKQYDSMINKISQKIIGPRISSTTKDNFKELEEFVSDDENIKVKLEALEYSPDADSSHAKALLTAVVHERNYTKTTRKPYSDINKLTSLKIQIEDSMNNLGVALSFLEEKLNTKVRKEWFIRNSKNLYCVIDLAVLLSEIYLANKIYKYLKSNPEAHEFIITNRILSMGYAPGEDERAHILSICEKYNIPTLDDALKITQKESVKNEYKYYEIKEITSLHNIYEKRNKLDDGRYHYNSYLNFGEHHREYYYRMLSMIILKNMIDDTEEIANELEQQRRNEKDYAASYEQKHNIPQKILAKMKNSQFLSHFGEVEYDELCQIEKITKIEEEFRNFARIVNYPIMKEWAIRFRRLGKYRAAGICFPYKKSICADLEGIDSFAHESAHMFDYTTIQGSKLSDLYNFRHIINRYKDLVTEGILMLDKEDPVRKTFYGNTKYNRSYYFTYTEIFARTFEVYLKHVLKIETSFLGNCDGIYYPRKEYFLKMLESYFKTIFPTIGESKEIFQEQNQVVSKINEKRESSEKPIELVVVGQPENKNKSKTLSGQLTFVIEQKITPNNKVS